MKLAKNSRIDNTDSRFNESEHGFSLVEIVVSVSLLLILVVLGISSYQGIAYHSKMVSTERAAETVYDVAYGYIFDNNPKTQPQDAVDDYNNSSSSKTVETSATINTVEKTYNYGIRSELPVQDNESPNKSSQKNKIFVELEMISESEIKITASYLGTDITAVRTTPSADSSHNGGGSVGKEEENAPEEPESTPGNGNGDGSTNPSENIDEENSNDLPEGDNETTPENDQENNEENETSPDTNIKIPDVFDKNAVSRLTYKCDTNKTGYIAVLNVDPSTQVFIKEKSQPDSSSTFVHYSNNFENFSIIDNVKNRIHLSNHSESLTLEANIVYEIIVYGGFEVLSSPGNSATGDNLSDCLISTGELGNDTGLEHITYLSGDRLANMPNSIPSTVKNLSGAFKDTELFNDSSIVSWDTSNIEDMSNLFNSAENFNQPIGGWSTGNVKDMSGMFENSVSFNQEVRKWDVKDVVSMSSMFKNAKSFNQGFSSWNTKSVVDLSSMFEGATSFNQKMSGFHTHNVTDMSYMFKNATSFNGKVNSWQTGNVKTMREMFYNAKSFNQSFNGWNVSNVVDYRDFATGSQIKKLPSF